MDALRYQSITPIAVGYTTADAATAAVGVIAVMVARCLRNIEERLNRIENLLA